MLILEGCHGPNLASRVVKLCLQRLGQDWSDRYAHPVADRDYWGIETGLHLRLDVSAGEDRSRVRDRTSALNLALLRRAALSVAVDWIRRARPRRHATTRGFFDAVSARQRRKAFSLVTARYSSALSTS